METTEILFDFAFFLAIWNAGSPLVVSFFKNWFGNWPDWFKQLASILMAVLGSVAAYAVSAGLGTEVITEASFWQPFVVGVVGSVVVQYGIWKAYWQGGNVESSLANLTVLNHSSKPESYEAKAA